MLLQLRFIAYNNLNSRFDPFSLDHLNKYINDKTKIYTIITVKYIKLNIRLCIFTYLFIVN